MVFSRSGALSLMIQVTSLKSYHNFFKKSFIIFFIFFIELFQSHDLDHEFGKIISVITSLSWVIFYVFFFFLPHFNT